MPVYQWNRWWSCHGASADQGAAHAGGPRRVPDRDLRLRFRRPVARTKPSRTRGLKPNVVLSAQDADVIKTYVELGLGVGIMARWRSTRSAGPEQCSSPGSKKTRSPGRMISIRAAAVLRAADALEDVDGLAIGVGVPGGPGARREVDAARAQAGAARRSRDRVDVDRAGEPVRSARPASRWSS